MLNLDSALALLEALNRDDTHEVNERISDRMQATQWIDIAVDVAKIRNAEVTFQHGTSKITAFEFATLYKDDATMKRLVTEVGAKATKRDANNETALYKACLSAKDAKEKVEYLLDLGLELAVTMGNSFQTTPLHAAALAGNNDVIEILIKHGADVDATTLDGRTALHYACLRGHTRCTKTLLDNRANANAKDNELKRAPLHVAAEFNRTDCIDVLLSDKYDTIVNVTDAHGATALHRAAAYTHFDKFEAFKLLLSNKKCYQGAHNRDGETAKLGGRGHVLGDRASACDMAQHALRAVTASLSAFSAFFCASSAAASCSSAFASAAAASSRISLASRRVASAFISDCLDVSPPHPGMARRSKTAKNRNR